MDIDAEPANDEHPEANGRRQQPDIALYRASIARCSISQGQARWRRYCTVLDRSCAPRSADARVGTKEWALQVEQKNGRKCKGGREIGLDSAAWRFSDAGRISAWRVTSCRRPRNLHMNRLMRCNKIGLGSKLVSAAQLVRLLQIDYAGPQRGKGAGSVCGDRASAGRSWGVRLARSNISSIEDEACAGI